MRAFLEDRQQEHRQVAYEFHLKMLLNGLAQLSQCVAITGIIRESYFEFGNSRRGTIQQIPVVIDVADDFNYSAITVTVHLMRECLAHRTVTPGIGTTKTLMSLVRATFAMDSRQRFQVTAPRLSDLARRERWTR